MNMLGICKECTWNMHGIRIEYAWNIHDYAWNMQGICLEYAWDTDRKCLDYAEYAWNMFGIMELAIWKVRVQRDLKSMLWDGTLRRRCKPCKLPCREIRPWNMQEGSSKKIANIQILLPVLFW